jgi:hypothetical protein
MIKRLAVKMRSDFNHNHLGLGTLNMLTLKSLTIVMFLLTLCFPVMAQKTPDSAQKARDEICQKVVCRQPTTVKLKLNKKEYVEFNFPKTPYVAEGYINILAGEEINVEFDEGAAGLSNARFVKEISAPEKTVTFKLSRTEDGTILSVKNPFSKKIIYKCLIQYYNSQNLRETSILPVESHLLGLEMWEEPIPQMVISEVRFFSEKKE